MKSLMEQRISEENLKSLSQFILDEAKKVKATQAEVNLSLNKGFTVTGREGSVETVEYHQDKGVDITVYFGKRRGSASVTDLSKNAIQEAVAHAAHIAKFTGEDEAAGLAEVQELAFDYPEIAASFPWDITVAEAIQQVIACEAAALQVDSRIISAEEVSLTTAQSLHVYANSQGFCGSFPFSQHQMTCVLVAKQNDEMQRDYSYTVAADPSDLQSPHFIAEEAAERTLKRLGARSLSPMKIPVIFAAEEARGLIGHFASAIKGGSIYRKASFLADQLGRKIFPAFINIYEQPHLAKALGSAPFDNDGVGTRANQFIRAGELQHYGLSVYTARKLGQKTTGNAGGFHNLTISPGKKDLAALLKQMNKGLLITEMMGNGVNLLTGDYSRGAGGYWVENGEIQYPVHEVTVAGRLQDIYAHIVEVGTDIDVRGNIRTGSIFIEEMMIAGNHE